MRLLSNRHIKSLFCRELLLLLACVLLSAVIIGPGPEHAVLYVLASFLCTGLLMLATLYRYFTEQSRVIDHAAAQIREYLSGNPQDVYKRQVPVYCVEKSPNGVHSSALSILSMVASAAVLPP